jgi:hypothetical protein
MKRALICRTKEIRGNEIPGIIHNGSYFLTQLQVFADGLINCWEMVDLPMFKEKLRCGWVVTSIPDGAKLNIHGIGSVEVISPVWKYTPNSLVEFVQETIKTLNPRLENLHDCHGRDTEEINGVRYAAVNTDNPRPWKTDQPISPLVRGMFGGSLRHFQVSSGVLHLVTIQLFKDDSAVIFGAAEPQTLDFASLVKQLENRDRFRFPESGERVVIEDLVEFVAGSWPYRVDPGQLAAEFHDLHDRVHGRPGAIQECMRAFRDYVAAQSIENLNVLRQKYEAVPEHLRMYCGDMDVKDIPIRMVLYGKSEIENWSHYQVAKQSGDILPSIDIPEPPQDGKMSPS